MRLTENILTFAQNNPQIDTFLFDRDGTIMEKNVPFDGAKEAMRELVKSGKKVIIVTNRTQTCQLNEEELAKFGGFCKGKHYEKMFSTGDIMKHLFAQKDFADARFLVLGQLFDEDLFTSSKQFTASLGPDDFTEKLATNDYSTIFLSAPRLNGKVQTDLDAFADAIKAAVEAKLPIYCGHEDKKNYESGKWVLLQGDVTAAMRQYAAKKSLPLEIHSFGKPKTEGFKSILEANYPDFSPARSVMIGDNPATDIVFGKRLGVMTVLCMSAPRPITVKPSYVIPAVGYKGCFKANPEWFYQQQR